FRRRATRLAAAVSSRPKEECVIVKALVPLLLLAAAGTACAEPPSPAELLPELRKGGYVLFIRHPKTNPDQADTDPPHLDHRKGHEQKGEPGASAPGGDTPVQQIPPGPLPTHP